MSAPDFNDQAGTFLRVDVDDGGWFGIRAHEESVVLKALRDFRERGIDGVLEVEDRHGITVHLVAATITSVRRSTPETRRANVLDALREEEWERELRRQYATPEWDQGE